MIINSNNDIYKPFEILNRSITSGGISLKKYDIKLIDYNNYGLYLDNNTDTLEKIKLNNYRTKISKLVSKKKNRNTLSKYEQYVV